MKLLTPAHANAKTAKNKQFDQYLSYILHLAPYKLSGVNLCPKASKGCAAACLNTAGRGRFDSVKNGRLRKSQLFLEQRNLFMNLLVKDIEAACRKAKRENKTPVIRLNGTSDINWASVRIDGKNLFELFPDVQFYDYTKVLTRLKTRYPNYDLTFSKSESNDSEVAEALRLGYNVAIVFDQIPLTYLGYETINGDDYDLRFLDSKGSKIVALKAKGDAKKDESGFVVKTQVDSIQTIKEAV